MGISRVFGVGHTLEWGHDRRTVDQHRTTEPIDRSSPNGGGRRE
ncbi:hypothetical protein [Natronobacterium texcoconense]|nr:hypothetical protein [Natronobacterium texcoconense]